MMICIDQNMVVRYLQLIHCVLCWRSFNW